MECSLKTSSYEKFVQDMLDEANISYTTEKMMRGMVYENSLRFDIWVEDQYAIEVDGEGHYQAINIFKEKKGLESTKTRDRLKDYYCFKHNIPLIRIPYFALDDITIEDLIPETSRYLVERKDNEEDFSNCAGNSHADTECSFCD